MTTPGIVVAQSVSANGHVYSEGALLQMAKLLRGMPVLAKEPDLGSSQIGDVCGIVTASEMKGDKVEVAVTWFEGRMPSEKFLTPTGVALSMKDGVVEAYQAEHLIVSDSSALEDATKLP